MNDYHSYHVCCIRNTDVIKSDYGGWNNHNSMHMTVLCCRFFQISTVCPGCMSKR